MKQALHLWLEACRRTPKRPGADYLELRRQRAEHRGGVASPSEPPTEGKEEPPPIVTGRGGFRGRSTPPGYVPSAKKATRNFGLERCECRCGGGQWLPVVPWFLFLRTVLVLICGSYLWFLFTCSSSVKFGFV